MNPRLFISRSVLTLLLVAIIAVTTLGLPTANASPGPKVLVLGFDGMDPILLERFRAEGVLPNFERFLADGGHYTDFGTSMPPQSPVAWSCFITGRDPGGHGIFDFIHRDPETLLPFFSTSEAKAPTRFLKLGGWKLPLDGGEVLNLRQGTAFWELLADQGIDATIFKVPSNFPPVECEARSLSGMGTPDLTGNYGISTLITDAPPADQDLAGGRVVTVSAIARHFRTELLGPPNSWKDGDPQAEAPLEGIIDRGNRSVWLKAGNTELVLEEGEWSDWVTVDFAMVPLLKSVTGICRFFFIATDPLRIYVTPIQIDPSRPAMPISTPEHYSRDLVDQIGPYYTQGLPDDTSALENGVFDDSQYVAQSDLVLHERLGQLSVELNRFAELDSGMLFFYFNSPDQTCHMVWRNMDPGSPTHAEADSHHAHRIREVYQALDAALGLALGAVDDDTVVMIMSDHGFAPWNRSFHVNRWLYENGYLFLEEGVDPANVTMLLGVDWSRTVAYAIGINGLYLNLAGRERDGIVQPGAEQATLLMEIVDGLEETVDPLSGQRAIKAAFRSEDIYHGPARALGPDVVIGYYRGWRGSNESALGEVPEHVFTDNLLKWSGDHCIAADEVPGVLLANRPILKTNPALVDMAPTILRLFGLTPPIEMVGGDLFEPEAAPQKGAH